ncbi:MAG: hypothetical protein JNL36_05310 [Candidatus Kapabacteria bacterium]|nr:hypothetical protein [Candidatus Kapabacteria bacterium]
MIIILRYTSHICCLLVLFSLFSCTQNEEEVDTKRSEIEVIDTTKIAIPQHNKQLTTIANVLAGMSVDNDARYTKITSKKTWFLYKTLFGNIWEDFVESRSQLMNEWADKNINDIQNSAKTLFYPFGGPDFTMAYSMFPTADRYILMGLEPVGIIPNFALLSDTTFKTFSTNMINSMKTYCSFGFFITKEMQQDLSIRGVNGVLPIIMIMMARDKMLLHSINHIYLDSNATIVKRTTNMNGVPDKEFKGIEGVEILFSKPGKKKIDVCYYFKTDLSNGSPKSTETMEKFLQKNDDTVATFLKAASYLMHNGVFSLIRTMIINNSSYILQDDSGMPIVALDSNQWNISLYGEYTKPIAVFKGLYQPILTKKYSTESKGRFMFGYGYKHTPGSSNIQVFRKNTKQIDLL